MAKKKIGIYGQLNSTANNKVEDLYLVVDDHAISFSVKNIQNDSYVAFESFAHTNEDSGWSQLVAYLQNNSKLIHAFYRQIHFVLNQPRMLLSKVQEKKDLTIYMNELNLIQGEKFDEEVVVNTLAYIENGVVVYSVPDSLQSLLSRVFPTGKWSHYAKHLIEKQRENGIYLQVFNSFLCVHIVKDQLTQLLQYIPVESDSQNIYSILNACKALNINPSQMEINVAGFNQEQSHWLNELMHYFEKSYIIIAPDNGVGANLNKEYPQHSFAPYFIF